ncbi:N-acetyltransferase [Kitasatospora sp. NPDC002040]|uniref:GNAT family N-acetyltransferase n=1 Tax=Kitasatospora sp. NPDC002040 TaxID=3154661 RepID=UPI00333045B0
MSWLPEDFEHPVHEPVLDGYHLRPIRADDTEIDYPAVMGSRERLWSLYGLPWSWPPATMTVEQDRVDLARHEREAEAHQSFNYAFLDTAEGALYGCVYIDPPERPGADADISWWVVDNLVGTPVGAALDAFVPKWIASRWPFAQPRYPGIDLSWEEWLALPE